MNRKAVSNISRAYHAELDKYAKQNKREASPYVRQQLRRMVLTQMKDTYPEEVKAIITYLDAFGQRASTMRKGGSSKGKGAWRPLTELERTGKLIMNIINQDSRLRTVARKEREEEAASPAAPTPVEAANSTPNTITEEQPDSVRPHAEKIYERCIATLHCAPSDHVAAILLGVHMSEVAKWRYALRHRFDFTALVVKGLPTATSTVWAATPINVEDRRTTLIKSISKKMEQVSLDDLASLADLLDKR